MGAFEEREVIASRSFVLHLMRPYWQRYGVTSKLLKDLDSAQRLGPDARGDLRGERSAGLQLLPGEKKKKVKGGGT